MSDTPHPASGAASESDPLRGAMAPLLRRQARLEIRQLAHDLQQENQQRLWRFVDRVTRRLSDDDVMDVMVEEFLLELKADRVGYVVAEETDGEWTFAVSHEAADKGVKRLPLPYVVSPDSSEDFHAFLEAALRKGEPEVSAWPNPIKIQSEPHFQEELREEFQAALEEEFGMARFVSCRSAMACVVETAKGGRALFCAQRVQGRAPWTRFQRELFREMCRYSASMLDQTQLAEQVRDLTDQFSSLIASMPSAIVGMDLLGTVAMWNGKAEEIFGVSEEDALGRVFWDMVPEFAFVESGVGRILQMDAGANLDFDLTPYRKEKGRQVFLRASLFTLFGSDRGEVALRIDDVTGAEELRQKLSLSQRKEMQGSLLEAAGHELQNLLTAAQGRLWLMEQAFPAEGIPGDSLRVEFKELKSLTDKATGALGRLLALSGELPAGQEKFEMREAVREAVELCRKTFGPAVTLLQREEEGPTTVYANRHQAEQAVLNLLLHARAGIRQGGVLVVRLQPGKSGAIRSDKNHWIRLRVEAKGGKETVPTPEVAASSLGWTVACALAEHCGGVAEEETLADGVRVFGLSFPVADASVEAEELQLNPPLSGHGRVMLVQSNAALRETTLRLLLKLGYEAEGCADGASAVSRLEGGVACDLALVDLDLPVLNGRDTVAVLRTMRPDLKVIFLGASSKVSRHGIPADAVLLPRSHRIQEFAAAIGAVLAGVSRLSVPG